MEMLQIHNKHVLEMVSGAFYIPKNDVEKPLGQDAHFISADNQTMGVADGVGGLFKQGIDSGLYARELMRNAAIAVERRIESVHPKRVLLEAFSMTTMQQGASTACIVSHDDGVLHAVNVGDSGFMIFRDNKLSYKSPTQVRRFNCPYHIGTRKTSVAPECALKFQVEVRTGDIVVLGSDGLLDNLFGWESAEIIENDYSSGGYNDNKIKVEDLAYKIAEKAYCKSLDKCCETPFGKAFRSFVGEEFKGGKKDDITVLVGQIIRVDSAASFIEALAKLGQIFCFNF